jgi:hypothetical protein
VKEIVMWKLILGVVFLAVTNTNAHAQFSGLPQATQKVTTRFGTLTVAKDRILLFKGHKLEPSIEGNNSLNLGTLLHIGPNDVVLVMDNGGTACPFLYYFLTVNKGGARATKSFGTCAELASIKRSADSISVRMPGFRGPFEPASEQRKANKERHVFLFHDGVVTENGKPVE